MASSIAARFSDSLSSPSCHLLRGVRCAGPASRVVRATRCRQGERCVSPRRPAQDQQRGSGTAAVVATEEAR